MAERYRRLAADGHGAACPPSRAHARHQSKNTQLTSQSPKNKPTPIPSAPGKPSSGNVADPWRLDPLEVIEHAADRLRIDGPDRLEQLAMNVRKTIADPEMDGWIPERLAWAVVEGCLPIAKLKWLCRYIAGKRERGEVKTTSGRLCNALGKKLASQYRFEWSPVAAQQTPGSDR